MDPIEAAKRTNKAKHCVGKDCFERFNFLYQLSNISLTKNKDQSVNPFYLHLLLNSAKKCVYRLEPYVKRTICKKCNSLLIPGISAKVRIRKKRSLWHCNKCHATKSFNCQSNYKLWIEDPKSIVEILEY